MRQPAGDPIGLLLSSLRVYSPTNEEAEYASFLADAVSHLGYSKVRIDRAGNVLGGIGHGPIELLLCGHMDTVPGRLPVKRVRGWVYGRGAADAKSPLCALALAGAAAADSGVRVTFAGVTQEEGEGAGRETLMRSGAMFDFAVFGEPSGAEKITIGYRGRVCVYVKVKTTGGHAGSPWANKSAFDEFNSALSRLKEYERTKEAEGDHFRSLTITPTLVRAGSYHNVIPGLCEATLDLRLPPSISSSDALKAVRSAAQDTGPGVDIEVTFGEPTEAYEADPSSVLVRAFQRAILLRLKTRPTLVRKTGTGDMNTFALRRGVSCVTYGPGISRSSHTDDEAVEEKDYLASIEVLKEAILQLGGLGAKGRR